jgi:hypothetical protein
VGQSDLTHFPSGRAGGGEEHGIQEGHASGREFEHLKKKARLLAFLVWSFTQIVSLEGAMQKSLASVLFCFALLAQEALGASEEGRKDNSPGAFGGALGLMHHGKLIGRVFFEVAKDFLSGQEILKKEERIASKHLKTCQNELANFSDTKSYSPTFKRSGTGNHYWGHFGGTWYSPKIGQALGECPKKMASMARKDMEQNFISDDFKKYCRILSQFVDCANKLRAAYEGGSGPGKTSPREPASDDGDTVE